MEKTPKSPKATGKAKERASQFGKDMAELERDRATLRMLVGEKLWTRSHFSVPEHKKFGNLRESMWAAKASIKREIFHVEHYGKPSEACFCKLFRKRCPSDCRFKGVAGGLFDHGRMYCKDGEHTFIGEPYNIHETGPFEGSVGQLFLLSNLYGLSIEISAHGSSWAPGRTLEIIFRPDKDRNLPHNGCRDCGHYDAFDFCRAYNVKIWPAGNEYQWCRRRVKPKGHDRGLPGS